MKTYTVVYRTGGTHNFSWKKSVPYQSYASAAACKNDIERGGRKALIFDTKQLEKVGLPETYEAMP